MSIYRFAPETERRQRGALRNALGATLARALDDENITDILINPDGALWHDTLSEGLVDSGQTIPPERTATLLAFIAGLLDKILDADHPALEGELPYDGSRIEGLIQPVTSAPALAIRKRANKIFPLDDYLTPPADTSKDGRWAEAAPPERGYGDTLRWAARTRKNVLVAGATGSAKTSFLNSLLRLMVEESDPRERLVTVEDTYELRCPAKNLLQIHTVKAFPLVQAVRAALRVRPDRIIIGEVRGGEALDLLKAWNTGHRGNAGTLHANSALDALYRLEELTGEVSAQPQTRLIGRAIDLVVFMERTGPRTRSIVEMLRVQGHDGNDYTVESVVP